MKDIDFGFVVGISLGVLIIAFIIFNFHPSFIKGQEARTFVAERYNFTEEECVENETIKLENVTVDKLNKFYVPIILPQRERLCQDIQGITLFNCSFKICSRYCHTTQVKEEICVNDSSRADIVEHCARRYPNKEGLMTDYRHVFTLYNATQDEIRNKVDSYLLSHKWGCGYSVFYGGWHDAVCIPTYKNVTFGCQHGEDVREARRLVG